MKTSNIVTISSQYHFDKSQVLGKGSTGQVYLGQQTTTGKNVAVKMIRLQTIDNEVTQYLLKMEKKALMTLNHQNVLKGLKIIETSTKCFMVTQLCNGDTLKSLIKKQKCLSEQKSIQLLSGILKGLYILTKQKITHRDLKPANIMLHNEIPKIIDFGYCQIQNYPKPSLQYNVGSPSYMSPQTFQNNVYNQKTEIWALGVVFYQCLNGSTFDHANYMTEVYKRIKNQGLPWTTRNISQKSKNIVNWCLQFNPNNRPTTIQLVNYLDQNKQVIQPQLHNLSSYQRRKNVSLYVSNQQSTDETLKRQTPLFSNYIHSKYSSSNTARQLNEQFSNDKLIDQHIQKTINQKRNKINNPCIDDIKVVSIKNRCRVQSNYSVREQYGLKPHKFVVKHDKIFSAKQINNILSKQHSIIKQSTHSTIKQSTDLKQSAQIVIRQKNPQSSFSKPLLKQTFKRKPHPSFTAAITSDRINKKLVYKKQNTQVQQIIMKDCNNEKRERNLYQSFREIRDKQILKYKKTQEYTNSKREKYISTIQQKVINR